MDIKKIGSLLGKINKLYAVLEENESSVSALEKDLLLNYLRDVYDAIIADGQVKNKPLAESGIKYKSIISEQEKRMKELEAAKKAAEARAKEEQQKREMAEKLALEEYNRKKALEEAARNEAKRKAEAEARLLQDARRKVEEDEKKRKLIEEETRRKIEEARKKEAEELAKKKKTEPIILSSINSNYSFNEDYEELFEMEETRELSQKISLRPISNLKSAVGINDRLLFINELFNKDKTEYDRTINVLNGYADFDEARAFLERNVIKKYNWTAKKRKKLSKDFITIVRRRYL